MKSEVTVFKHKDVRGKESPYLKILNEKGQDYLINIGEKTFDNLTKMGFGISNEPPKKEK